MWPDLCRSSCFCADDLCKGADMNVSNLYPSIRSIVKFTLPEEVRDEAIDLALNIAADDRSGYRALNEKTMSDLFEEFRYQCDPETMLRHIITGDFESARNLVFKFLEDKATEIVETRPTMTEEELAEDLLLSDPKSWASKERDLWT